MPCCWVLSYTPAKHGEVSRNVPLVSSSGFKARKGWDLLPLACVELEQEDALKKKKYTPKPKAVNLCSRYSCTALLEALSFFPPCTLEQKEVQSCVFQQDDCCTHFSQMKACDSDAEQSRGSARGLSDLPLCGSSVSPIFAIGLLFSDDLFNDKWRVTNFTIMLFVFPEKWKDIISLDERLNMLLKCTDRDIN